MDLLDSILSSMDKPPSASEAEKNALRKQKEAMEKKQNEEKTKLTNFRKSVEDKITKFICEGKTQHLQFEPMDQRYRSIIRDVAETAGVQVFSFGEEGVDRYSVVYIKEKGPSEDEITVRKAGEVWNKEKAEEMQKLREERQILEREENEEQNLKRKRGKEELSGAFYKQKYAHLIGEDAALDAAKKTDMNKSYGEVPSENKKDVRSIEQMMADIQAKKRKKIESESSTNVTTK